MSADFRGFSRAGSVTAPFAVRAAAPPRRVIGAATTAASLVHSPSIATPKQLAQLARALFGDRILQLIVHRRIVGRP
jgi:hypothetical protein